MRMSLRPASSMLKGSAGWIPSQTLQRTSSSIIVGVSVSSRPSQTFWARDHGMAHGHLPVSACVPDCTHISFKNLRLSLD